MNLLLLLKILHISDYLTHDHQLCSTLLLSCGQSVYLRFYLSVNVCVCFSPGLFVRSLSCAPPPSDHSARWSSSPVYWWCLSGRLCSCTKHTNNQPTTSCSPALYITANLWSEKMTLKGHMTDLSSVLREFSSSLTLLSALEMTSSWTLELWSSSTSRRSSRSCTHGKRWN